MAANWKRQQQAAAAWKWVSQSEPEFTAQFEQILFSLSLYSPQKQHRPHTIYIYHKCKLMLPGQWLRVRTHTHRGLYSRMHTQTCNTNFRFRLCVGRRRRRLPRANQPRCVCVQNEQTVLNCFNHFEVYVSTALMQFSSFTLNFLSHSVGPFFYRSIFWLHRLLFHVAILRHAALCIAVD